MKLKSITISGFHNVDSKTYEFDNINYITGPNGAGKSTILNAIEYGLFGYVPGTKKNSYEALFRHSSKNSMNVELHIESDSGEIRLFRSLSRCGVKYVNTFTIDPDNYTIDDIISDIELPVFNFSDFINMTSNSLKDWFLNFLPSTSFETDWETVLSNNSGVANILDTELLPTTVSEIKSFGLSGIEELRKANEYIKSMLSFKKQSAQRLQNTMQSLVYYDDFSSTMSVDAIKSEISKYEAQKQLLIDYNTVRSKNDTVRMQINNLHNDVDIDELRSNIETLQIDFDAVSAKILKLNPSIAGLESEISMKTKVINGGGVCPYTASHCNEISVLVASYRNQVIQDTAKLSEYKTQVLKLQEELSSIKTKLSVKKQQLQDSELTNHKIAVLNAAILPLPEIPNDLCTMEDINSKLDQLHDSLIKLEANQKYQTMIDTLTQEKSMIDQSVDILKKWDALTGINGLQATSGDDPFVEFSKSITDYLPQVFSDAKIQFNSQGKTNTFSFGLVRNNKYITFDLLSSGEKCIYTLALLVALVKQSSSNLKLLVVDDLFDHLDPTNLCSLFERLSNVSDVQLIIAGVVALPDYIDSVNVVNISKEN